MLFDFPCRLLSKYKTSRFGIFIHRSWYTVAIIWNHKENFMDSKYNLNCKNAIWKEKWNTEAFVDVSRWILEKYLPWAEPNEKRRVEKALTNSKNKFAKKCKNDINTKHLLINHINVSLHATCLGNLTHAHPVLDSILHNIPGVWNVILWRTRQALTPSKEHRGFQSK